MDGQHQVMKPEIVEIVQGAAAPEPVREEAYQLWAWEHKQSCEKVATELGLHGKTVRRWCQADGWRLRYEDERSELSPGIARYATARQIQNGLPGAVAYVDAVANGIVEADKSRLIACKMLMDAAGFAPIHYTGEIAKPVNAAVEGLPDLSTLSLEQVQALEAIYNQKKAITSGRK